ncbi:MAG TPA: RsmD family RNA methyltransferase, partial [Nocardioidaceae bacterium]|nr:RsmD family RNA methyltransferase [Nocardioidaceae bacterium]
AALNTAVLDFLRPLPGERVLDLFSGVGLFSGALAAAVGTSGTVLAVEGDRRAAADARRNLHDLRQVRIVHGRVDAVLAGDSVGDPDLVVLDPPRVGARREVVTPLSRLAPRAVAYVSCDPAALARDVADFVGCGYRLAGLRAFDIFPMTHHVECVALLVPDGSTHQPR